MPQQKNGEGEGAKGGAMTDTSSIIDEPDFIRETDDVGDTTEAKVWFGKVREAFTSEGATWCRFSWMPDGKRLLVEGWRVRPSNEGPTRWGAPR
jgi:hypothetical protein